MKHQHDGIFAELSSTATFLHHFTLHSPLQ